MTDERIKKTSCFSPARAVGWRLFLSFSLHLAESIKYISANTVTATLKHIKQNASMFFLSPSLLFSRQIWCFFTFHAQLNWVYLSLYYLSTSLKSHSSSLLCIILSYKTCLYTLCCLRSFLSLLFFRGLLPADQGHLITTDFPLHVSTTTTVHFTSPQRQN